MAERTPERVVPVLGKRAAAVALALKRHVLVAKGLLPEATAEAAALPDGKRWRRNLPSTAT